MGWAARWLRVLFGFGRKASSSSGESKPEKEKKRWGFGKSSREKAPARSSSSILATPWRAYDVVEEGEEEQSKRAIAVAAATAAVADAAVAAAQAAAAVVRLTSKGRCMSSVARQEWAAIRIQAAFRGYLARRALKALRGLVKMQALVRGNIVRRQAAKTLQCMHALVRVQASARACRSLRSQRGAAHRGITRVSEKYDQAVSVDATKSDVSCYLERSSSKTSGSERLGRERSQSCGRNWLDGWSEERCMDDENSKILEVDTSKSGRHSSRRHGGRRGGNHLQLSCSTMTSDQNSRSFATVPESPFNDSTPAEMSVPSPSSVGMGEQQSPWQLPIDNAGLSATSRPGSSRRGPFTPTQSECSRSLYGGYSDYPNYMANTESFRAKARSQSAPKQRLQYDKSGLARKASAQGPCAPAAQASASVHAKFTSKAYPGSGRLDRLGLAFK